MQGQKESNTTMDLTPIETWASYYQSLGWPTVYVGEIAIDARGKKELRDVEPWESATADMPVRRGKSHQATALGVRTGKISGLAVIDIDGDCPAWDALLAEHDPLETWQSQTRSFGSHYGFAWDDRMERFTKNDVGLAAHMVDDVKMGAIDLRMNGRIIFAPPSQCSDGTGYSIIDDSEPIPMPDWLFEALCRWQDEKAASKKKATSTIDAAVEININEDDVRLKNALGDLIGAVDGEKHSVLNRSCFIIGGLCASGILTKERAVELVVEACKANGRYPFDPAQKTTMLGALRAGFEEPLGASVEEDLNDILGFNDPGLHMVARGEAIPETVEINQSIDTDEVMEALEAEVARAKEDVEKAQAKFDDKDTEAAEKKLDKAKRRLEACLNAQAGWATYVLTKVKPPYRIWTDIAYIAGIELPGAHLDKVEHLLQAVAKAAKVLEKEFIRTNDGSLLRKEKHVYTMIPPDSILSLVVGRTKICLPMHYDPATMTFTELENLGSLPGQSRWVKRVLDELPRVDDADINPISAADWLNTPEGEFWIGLGEEPVEKPGAIWTHVTKVVPADGPTPMLETWLKSQFGEDSKRKNRVLAQLGAAMTGRAVREKIAMWHGTGGTGKTSITTAYATLLGGYAYTLESTKLEKGQHGHEEWKAELRGRRLVLVDELPESKQLSAQLLKNVSGGGDLSARFLNQKRFTFPAQANLLITANDLPRVASYDPGIRRRFDIVRMDGLASGEWDSVESFVRAMIVSEGPAVLAKAIQAYRAAGGWPPEIRDDQGVSENDDHFDEMDSLKHWLESGYTMVGSSWTATGVLYGEFVTWCKKINAADFSMSQRQFAYQLGKRLNQKAIQVQGTGPRGYMLSVLDPLNRSIF